MSRELWSVLITAVCGTTTRASDGTLNVHALCSAMLWTQRRTTVGESVAMVDMSVALASAGIETLQCNVLHERSDSAMLAA